MPHTGGKEALSLVFSIHRWRVSNLDHGSRVLRATQGEIENPNDFIIISFGIKSKPKRCVEGIEFSESEIGIRKVEKLITGKVE